jgi:DNA-binding PadR family transcriptional regulator
MSTKAQDWVQDSVNSLIYVLILEIIKDKPSYGYLIQNTIESKIKNMFPDYKLSFSSLYTILRKLELKYNLITTIECPDVTDIREKARRCYEITKNGILTYQQSTEDWKKFSNLLYSLHLT